MNRGATEHTSAALGAPLISFKNRAESGKLIKLHTQQMLSEKVLRPTEERKKGLLDDDSISVTSTNDKYAVCKGYSKCVIH